MTFRTKNRIKGPNFLKKFCSRAVNRTFAEGSHRNFPSPKKGASPPFLRLKTVYWGYFSFKKASVLSHGEGRDWTTRSLRFPRRHSPLFQYKRHPSLKDERGIGHDAHFVSAQSLPSWRREGLDSAGIPFRQLLSRNKAFPFLNTREPFF